MSLSKDLRDKSGKKITEIANLLGVSRQLIYKSLQGNGSRNIRIALALILEKPPVEIYQYENEHVGVLDTHEWEKVSK